MMEVEEMKLQAESEREFEFKKLGLKVKLQDANFAYSTSGLGK